MVIGSLGPGGAERQCELLCQHLAQRKGNQIDDVRVFVSSLSRTPRDAFFKSNIEDAGILVMDYESPSAPVALHDSILHHKTEGNIELLQPPSKRLSIMRLYNSLFNFNPHIVHGWLDDSVYIGGLATSLLGQARFVGRWGSLPPTWRRVSSPSDRDRAERMRNAYHALWERSNVQFFTNARVSKQLNVRSLP